MSGSITPSFGWIPPEDRTKEQHELNDFILAGLPTVTEAFPTASSADEKRPRWWEIIKVANQRGLIDQRFVRKDTLKNLYQLTGSCVGLGAANAIFWQSAIDSIVRNQPELISVPFPFYHYGRGRLASGIRGKGEGSFGTGQAKQLQTEGYLNWDSLDVPAPRFRDRIEWTASQELQWSDGARIDSKYIEEGKKHLIPNVAKVTSIEEAVRLLDNGYTFTVASNMGLQMKCPVKNGVLLNSRSGRWNHQMWVLDYIQHPQLGLLFYWGNNWGYVHGVDPGGEWDNGTGAPEGGFYLSEEDTWYAVRQGEAFAFADPQGFYNKDHKFDFLLAG